MEREQVLVRSARWTDADSIARLNAEFASEGLMLPRTAESVAASIQDYVVAVDGRGALLACGALKEYSPSLAEVAAIAVAREAHGQGLGRLVVRAVEALAIKRGVEEVFALTLTPGFFESLGYARTDRARYPEKMRRDCQSCARRFACNESCLVRSLAADNEAAAPVREAA